MALGLTTATAEGGDFAQILKYDARAGRMFVVNRQQDDYGQWETNNVEVTNGFNAIFDLEQIQVGWVHFANGVAPNWSMVPLGQPMPAKPSADHRQAFRLLVKLGKSAGGDVREFASSAKAVINAMDALHTAFEKDRAANPGKLPVVAMTGATPITTTGKGQSSTNYAPDFEIVRWVARPQDLPGPDKAHASLPASAPRTAAPAANGREPGDDGEEYEAAPAARKGGRMAKAPITDDFDDDIPFASCDFEVEPMGVFAKERRRRF